MGKPKGYKSKTMEAMLQGMFLIFPASCAALAAYDIWSNGWQSPLLQIASGILFVFVLVQSAIRLFLIIDDAMEGWRTAVKSVGPRATLIRRKLTVIFSLQPTLLSRA